MPFRSDPADAAVAERSGGPTRQSRRSALSRRARRFALLGLSIGYGGFLLLLLPLGMVLGIFHQPFQKGLLYLLSERVEMSQRQMFGRSPL